MFAGLIDGDGSIGVSNSKNKVQVTFNYATSSPDLRDSVILVCRLLGIRCSYTTSHPKAGKLQKHDSYTISLSSVDLSKIVHELPCFDRPGLTILREQGVRKDDRDIVPVDHLLMKRLTTADGGLVSSFYLKQAINFGSYRSKSKSRGYTTISRTLAQTIIANYQGVNDALWSNFVRVVEDTHVHWATVKTVEEVPTELVFDIGVPDTKVFALSSGLIVYDTMNVSLPSMPESVQEAKDVLMPSRMLKSIKSPDTIVPALKHEQILGLYTSKNMPAQNTHKFATRDEAVEAMRTGAVRYSDNVQIGD